MKKARLSVLSCVSLLIAVQPMMAQQPMVRRSDIGTIQAEKALKDFKSLAKKTPAAIAQAKGFLKSKYRCLRHGEGCSKKERAAWAALAAVVATAVAVGTVKQIKKIDVHEVLKKKQVAEVAKPVGSAVYGEMGVLGYAINKNNIELAKEAIKDRKVENGMILAGRPFRVSALHWVARIGNRNEIAQALIDRGVDVNKVSGDGTALMSALDNNKFVTAQLLLNNKANLEAQDQHGYTVFARAINDGKVDVVKWLLNKGVDVNAKNPYGNTALTQAAELGKVDVVKLLLNRGVDVNAKDPYGNTAYDLAFTSSIKQLIQAKGGVSGVK